AVAEGLRSQVGGLKMAARNAQDGISVIQTAEGGLTETTSILQRLRDLAVQAGNDSNNDKSREAITSEATELISELDRISKTTNFNGINLLDGTAGSLKFQVGANGDAASQISVGLGASASVKGIADALKTSVAAGTSFAIADVAELTGAATFTTVKDNVSTSVTTKDLGTTFTSVESYAEALRGDEAFAAEFSVTVTKDANGAGNGIVVTARNGGDVATAGPVGETADADGTAGAGLAAGAVVAPGAAVVGIQFNSAENAQKAINTIDDQIEAVSSARSNLGAVQNRFESTINTLNVSAENLTAAESRIRDTDMASEMVNYTRSNILSQAGTAMLAQANQSNQGVLQLLG
ncbi:MAG: flagellin domain protein, partial [Glaciihabitans sp.]|nr:flagellin domain protein [Glaciihabitans sp.]